MENYIPKIRFKGAYNENGEWVEFTHPWEQRKFSELYVRSSEKNDGSIGMDKNITVATMQFKEDVQVSTAEYLKTYYTFNLGDIAFEGHQSKEFRYGRFVENDIGNGIVSHIFAVFRPIQEYDLYFWKYAINNETLMQRILGRSTKASTMMHDLVANDFLNETFLVPSIDEQKQIGSLFNKLDHLITLHQHKCELYQQAKQSMMEKLFTQSICFTSENGNEFPKWIEKTLQDLENENKITLNRGNIIPKSEGKYPVYSASTKNNGLMCYSDKYMFDEELITWSIDGGGDFFYRPKHKFSITNVSGYIKIIDQNYLIYKYLAYQLQYLHNFLRFDYLSKAHPSVIRELYTVHIPYLEEQIKIANILSKYDELIAISKNQLNTLQTLKKGLLQQMFV